MICFLVCRGFGSTVAPIQRDPRAPKITIRPYDNVLSQQVLPKATYVFVDIDRLSSADRLAAGQLFRRLAASGCRVLNDPARVRTRLPLLRTLHRQGVNGFNVYSVEEGEKPKRFPVFVRVADDHVGPLTDLISDQATLERANEALLKIGYPRSELIIVEYAAEPVRPGIFRKLSVFRVADQYIPHVNVHDTNWVIKSGRSGVAPSDLYDDELETLRTNPFAERMKAMFEIAEIDFGRVDFSFVDGRVCVYEINTNPTIAGPAPHSYTQRTESMRIWWESLLSALHAIDDPDAQATLVDVSGDDATTLREALDLYPWIRQGFLRLSEALSRRGDRTEAIESARAALAQKPDDANIVRRASQILADNGRLDEAIEITRQAVKTNPMDYLRLSEALSRRGERTEAIESAMAALAQKPDDAKIVRRASQVLANNDRLEDAIEITRQAVKTNPKNHDLLLQLATLLARAKRAPEALEVVHRAIGERPRDIRCYRALSEVHKVVGNLRGAVGAIKAAEKLVSEGKDPEAARHMKELRSQRRTLQTEAIRQHLRAIKHFVLARRR